MLKISAVLTIAIIVVPGFANSTTWTVNTGTNVQSVYNNASCGDTIELHFDAAYNGAWIFNKSCTAQYPLTVRNGQGHTPIVISTAARFSNAVEISGNYNTVDGIVIRDVYHGLAIYVRGNNNIVQNCIIDNIDYNNIALGAGADAILVVGESNIISNNYIGDADHGAIRLGDQYGSITRFNQILSNTIINRYGHGISIISNQAAYNLIDGNRIEDCGSLSNMANKNGIQISGGRNNSIRRNIFYNLYNRGVEVSSYSNATNSTNNNWIYNNTFFNISTRSSGTSPASWIVLGTGNVNPGTKYTTDNHFYNNIAEKVAQYNHVDIGVRVAFFYYYPYEQDLGDNLSELTTTNDWRNNWLRNNDIRPYNRGTSSYDDLAGGIRYTGSAYTGTWTITAVNGLGSQSGNIRQDPRFASTNTGAANWWYLQSDSPCIDAGIIVNDPNAAIGGWSQLTYAGSAPDIGAYEYAGVNPPAPSPSPPPGDASAPAPPTGLTITPQ